MKTIGILTWYFGANYGAIAQSTALYHAIQGMGYNCTMINYRPPKAMKTILFANIPPKHERIVKVDETLWGIKKCIKLSRVKKISESRRVHDAKEIDQLSLDCVVLGSDAIFNIKHPLFTSLYYGVGIKTKKITYSPSCEFLEETTGLPEEYKKSLNEMSAISVRDDNTCRLIKSNINQTPVITLDPAFLYGFKKYDQEIKFEKYILIYAFSAWDKYKDAIREYADKNGLPVVSVGKKRYWADYNFADASFELWISLFRKAEMVITDSFHGMVFALKNRKQMVLCGREDKQAKISSLLKKLNVSIDFYNGEAIEKYLDVNIINYSLIQKNIAQEVEKSRKYLLNAIG